MKRRIKVIVADDERLAREELVYLLSQEADLDIAAVAGNGRELLDMAELHRPDAVFLDIQMPEMGGIHAARRLAAQDRAPLLVFTTAYDEHAVEAFGLNATDYLLKPYSPQRLKESVSRVRKAIDRAEVPAAKPVPVKISKLLLEDGEKVSVIDPDTIFYAVKEEKYVQLHTLSGKYTTKLTLHDLEEKLSGHRFFRPHRSYLINLSHVQELVPWFNGAYNLVLRDKEKTNIPVSRDAAKELFKRLEQ